MKRVLVFVVCTAALSGMAFAADAGKVLSTAAQVVSKMSSTKQIPSSVLKSSKCIAVIPRLTKGGFIVGGQHGNGVVSCRTSAGWSAPGFISMAPATSSDLRRSAGDLERRVRYYAQPHFWFYLRSEP